MPITQAANKYLYEDLREPGGPTCRHNIRSRFKTWKSIMTPTRCRICNTSDRRQAISQMLSVTSSSNAYQTSDVSLPNPLNWLCTNGDRKAVTLSPKVCGCAHTTLDIAKDLSVNRLRAITELISHTS